MESANLVARTLELKINEDKVISFEDCWLRDHCRCVTCYHMDTNQRALHILNIPESEIDNYYVKDETLYITWDDGHESIYEKDFLTQFEYKIWRERNKLKHHYWCNSNVVTNISHIHVDKFLNSVEGAKNVFQSLLDYGVAFVEGVQPTLEATEKVCIALGGVQHTLFGGMWQFTTKADHADTAYTNLPLASHNDSTYFTEATGLQILHCVKHIHGEGGETTLVDGFYGATLLKKQHPEAFEFLKSFNVEAEYIEDGHHHKFSAPIINIDHETEDLKQIRFNVYDRSPIAFADGQTCRTYYNALRTFSKILEDPKNRIQFKLKPGTVLVIDNFRVLHGRTSFTGERVLCGSYVSRSDYLDRARTLRLIY